MSAAFNPLRPIPGPDPGACPKCGRWRKAGMVHVCDEPKPPEIPSAAREALEDAVLIGHYQDAVDAVRTVHVYCGCDISVGMFDDRECGWEGDVPISSDPGDRPFDHFDCPECGAAGLLVIDHAP